MKRKEKEKQKKEKKRKNRRKIEERKQKKFLLTVLQIVREVGCMYTVLCLRRSVVIHQPIFDALLPAR